MPLVKFVTPREEGRAQRHRRKVLRILRDFVSLYRTRVCVCRRPLECQYVRDPIPLVHDCRDFFFKFNYYAG